MSGSFTIVFQNQSSINLSLTCAPKKNVMKIKDKPVLVEGRAVKMTDNLECVKPGEEAHMAFATTGVVKAEVSQLISCYGSLHMTPDEMKAQDFEAAYIKEIMKDHKGEAPVGFLVQVYNETRMNKRNVFLICDVASVHDFEEGDHEIDADADVFLANHPKRNGLQMWPFKVSTTFKNSDNAVLSIRVANMEGVVKINPQVKTLFRDIDRDGSGEITVQEFVDYCKGKNPKADEKQLREMFTRIDSDGGGKVSLAEFCDKHQEIDKFLQMIELKFEAKSNKLMLTRKKTEEVFEKFTPAGKK
jgi:Ca2+-binding EF-hand superfamily protein